MFREDAEDNTLIDDFVMIEDEFQRIRQKCLGSRGGEQKDGRKDTAI